MIDNGPRRQNHLTQTITRNADTCARPSLAPRHIPLLSIPHNLTHHHLVNRTPPLIFRFAADSHWHDRQWRQNRLTQTITRNADTCARPSFAPRHIPLSSIPHNLTHHHLVDRTPPLIFRFAADSYWHDRQWRQNCLTQTITRNADT
jgi:hypothetical protein